MERVTGLGGPFIKANDPKALAAWYETHLGISFNGSTYTVWQFSDKDGGVYRQNKVNFSLEAVL